VAGKRKIILDFDGVIHSYGSGWTGVVPTDPPVLGAREAIRRIREHYKVYVMSTRCFEEGGVEAIEDYLREHDIEVDGVVKEKVKASLSIDDRGFRFEGDWNGVIDFLNDPECFNPWNKKGRPEPQRPIQRLEKEDE
jgi:hypothetical protein